ncbi:MAG: hypothetical protein DHS20C16_18330 [Phycisphaerae bacterium]|nr:MAG: hypothetical protein DHS20C16_18330 [Phycisphaerae bacterium]
MPNATTSAPINRNFVFAIALRMSSPREKFGFRTLTMLGRPFGYDISLVGCSPIGKFAMARCKRRFSAIESAIHR